MVFTWVKLAAGLTTLFNKLAGMFRDAVLRKQGRKEQALESMERESEEIRKANLAAINLDHSPDSVRNDKYNRD